MSATATDVLQDATKFHDVDTLDMELVAREVVEILVTCDRFSPGEQTQADKLLDYAAEAYMRKPLLANAAIDAYVEMGGSIVALVRCARRRRQEPKLGGYLSYLWTNLHDWEDEPRRRALLRPALERACMWGGLSLQDTKNRLAYYNLR